LGTIPGRRPPAMAVAVSTELGSSSPSGPTGRAVTAQGHPRRIFATAIERGNIVMAEATARELGRITLEEALGLTALVAEREPERRSPFAVRWLRRLLEEDETLTIEEAAVLLGTPAHAPSAVPFLSPIRAAGKRPEHWTGQAGEAGEERHPCGPSQNELRQHQTTRIDTERHEPARTAADIESSKDLSLRRLTRRPRGFLRPIAQPRCVPPARRRMPTDFRYRRQVPFR
jgi:hypothetical protein